ncbi:putative phage holin [Pseudokineococcus lusitanus]|uniref:Uncharacterized protein n=1 Tax=Pseudokineococcus lusitanus TaxID=763993 RepID=A0A3N1HTW0_9ACTN|nr:hypothetical protein [Pseudokineococcus lusitanus]ROP45965.1 hypothetical protein EDC03_0581 [Pseudokineococcus lusitanus]
MSQLLDLADRSFPELLYLGAVLLVLALAAYLVAARPLRSGAGRLLILLGGGWALTLLLVASTQLLGPYPARPLVRIAVYGLAVLAGGAFLTEICKQVRARSRRRTTQPRTRG